jgi:steroid 5-alpha reductase family enzyme
VNNLLLLSPGLGVMLIIGFVTWLLSVRLKDVSIVDSVWSLLFLAGLITYMFISGNTGALAMVSLLLVALWALRLSIYLTYRNWGEPEDRRYREMRDKHGQRFVTRSLYTIFSLQAVLAWFISLPLFAIAQSESGIGILALVGMVIVIFGVIFESLADLQLAGFMAREANHGKVMDKGLWQYSRHPNYFGEFCVWWGFYVIALAAGGWWTILSPILMSVLLLRVSGVTLLEKDIKSRRPGYEEYVNRTSAFVPLPPRS